MSLIPVWRGSFAHGSSVALLAGLSKGCPSHGNAICAVEKFLQRVGGVVEMDGKSPLLAQKAREKWGTRQRSWGSGVQSYGMVTPVPELGAVVSRTPCLDRLIPLPPPRRIDSRLKWWQLSLLSALLLVKLFFVLYTVLLLCILVHELGHLLAGTLVGFRLIYIRVGPLRIEHTGRLSWHWTWRALTSGATASYPVSQWGVRWRLFADVAGGPAANLASAFLVHMLLPDGSSVLIGAGFLFVGLSTLIGVMNLLSFRSGEPVPDGLQLWILLFSRKRRERLIFLLSFLSDFKRGDSRSFVDHKFLNQSTSVRDGSSQQTIADWLSYTKALEAKSFDDAALHLENCLTASSAAKKELREDLIVEAARFQALRRNRPDLARQWLDLGCSGPKPRRFFPEAIVLYRENRKEEALAKIEEGLAVYREMPSGPTRPDEQALEKLKNSLSMVAAVDAPVLDDAPV